MLLPLRHENMEGRRWPVITIGLIALNVLIFLVTHWAMSEEANRQGPVREQILALAATHPDLQIADEEVAKWVSTVRAANPIAWTRFAERQAALRAPLEAARETAGQPAAQPEEMDSLVQQLKDLQANSIRQRFAFYPAHPTASSYVTANFLHAGFLHIIRNMWFLWLAGFILADTWG